MRPPHEYYEMLARSSGTPLDMPPSIPFPSNGPPHYNQMGGPLGGPSPPLGFNQHNQPMGPPYFTGPGGPMAMPRSAAGQGRPAQFDSTQPDFYQGGHNALFVRGPPEGTPFRGPPEGMSNRGPPSADPRLHFVGSGQRPPPPQHPHPNSLPQDPSLQPFQIGQQYPPGQPQPLPSYMQPNMPAPPLLHPQMRPDLDHNRLRMGHAGLQGGRGPAQVFQQMAAATAGAESTGKTGYPKSEMMTSSDVRFVVTKVVQPLETNDPYSDDYYFLQVRIRMEDMVLTLCVW